MVYRPVIASSPVTPYQHSHPRTGELASDRGCDAPGCAISATVWVPTGFKHSEKVRGRWRTVGRYAPVCELHAQDFATRGYDVLKRSHMPPVQIVSGGLPSLGKRHS